MKRNAPDKMELELPADACVARVTGGEMDAACIVLDVGKLPVELVYRLGSMLEISGGFNVRREPGRGTPKTLVVHAGRVPLEDGERLGAPDAGTASPARSRRRVEHT